MPKNARREFEQAQHLLEEAERIQRRNRAAVERALTSDSRSELGEALEELRDVMSKQPFAEREFLDGYERAARLVSKHLGAWQKGELREYLESIGVAVGVALLLRAGVVEAFKIPSGSMLPTLQIQDHIFVNKLAYGPPIPFTGTRLFSRLPPKRGDVMVFEYPDPNPAAERQDFIKRVIALEGDTLSVEGGHPIINGWKVPSCLVGKYEFDEGPDSSVKRGDLFVEYLGEYSYLTLYEDGRTEGRQGRTRPSLARPGCSATTATTAVTHAPGTAAGAAACRTPTSRAAPCSSGSTSRKTAGPTWTGCSRTCWARPSYRSALRPKSWPASIAA